MLRYLADEDFDNRVLRAFQRLLPERDWVRIQDLGLSGSDDDRVLELAAADNRVVLSRDVSTMTAAAFRRIELGDAMQGLIVVPHHLSIGRVLDDLVFLAQDSAVDEWTGQVLFLPL